MQIHHGPYVKGIYVDSSRTLRERVYSQYSGGMQNPYRFVTEFVGYGRV